MSVTRKLKTEVIPECVIITTEAGNKFEIVAHGTDGIRVTAITSVSSQIVVAPVSVSCVNILEP